MSEQLKTYSDGSSSLVFPGADTPTVTVVLRIGMMLPRQSRTPARYNAGETVLLEAAEATALLTDGYAVRPGESTELDETPIPIECLAPFSLRGNSYHTNDLAFLPAWFVAKAKALELVGDPPAPKTEPTITPETKQAIENRRVRRQRKTAHDYLETLQ